jgi:L-lactate dehydrogenase complex protein LldG
MSIGESDKARADILATIRGAQGRARRESAADREAVDTYLRARPRGPLRPAPADIVAQFIETAQASQSTVELVKADGDVPLAVRRYLDSLSLPRSGCVWPELARLNWQGAGLDLAARAASGEDAVGVTGAFAAVSETGTLMVVSSPRTPASVSLLPETHVAVLRAERIFAHMEDAWDLARREMGQLPRAVNFISGPSRTADIEQEMILGAHGPYRVHVIVIRADS